MATPRHFKIADLGGEISDVQNSAGRSLYKTATIEWNKPRIWKSGEGAPTELAEFAAGYVYALTRDHHRQKHKDIISYIGLTRNLSHRFYNHSKANELLSKRGDVYLCIGQVTFERYHHRTGTAPAIEQIEHLLIWAISPELNERKMFTMPGMGANAGRPWHIINQGYRFSGLMPREIVFPWMLVKPGRDRSAKKASS